MLLLEVILALVVVAVATLSSASMTISGTNLNKANVAAADATDVMRQLVEELESHPFEEVYARFNADPTDDPEGAGTARGSQFVLEPNHRRALLDASVAAGTGDVKTAARHIAFDVEVFFPEDASGLLSEQVIAPLWGGTSWDIDGDGTAGTSGDRSADYKLLPVAVRLTWTDPDGIHALQVVRLLSRRRR